MELPGFQLIEPLREGGMAAVWKARQLSLDRIVAIKILSSKLASDQSDTARFLREAQSMAGLKHPGIIQVYDANIHEGVYYFVMEFVAGYSVGDWIRRKQGIPEADALLTAECVADALGYAWANQKIIHCDIKPDNVMIDSDGTIKVADLGLARSIIMASATADSNDVMGTPNYMSPEQVMGEPDIDCRSDIYALGAMLYHMVTGKMLFEDSEAAAAMEKQISDKVDDPIELNPALSMSICWLIEKMLAKDRNARQPDWTAVLSDIARVKRGAMIAGDEPVDGASTIRRSPKRTRPTNKYHDMLGKGESRGMSMSTRVAIAGAVLAMLAAGVALYVFQDQNETIVPKVTPIPVHHQPPPDDRTDKAAEMYDLAVDWYEANQGQYDAAMEQFLRVEAETKGTKYSLLASAKASEIAQAKEIAVQGAIASLKAQGDSLLAENEFERAAALYRDYNGPLSAETAPTRQQLEASAGRLAGEYKIAQVNASKERDRKAVALVDTVASQLANAGMDAARTTLAAGMAEPGMSERQELAEIDQLLRKTAELDQIILSSFNEQVGRVAAISLRSGSKTVKIMRVSGTVIRGEENIAKDGYSISRPVEIDISQLSSMEIMKRLGPGDEREVMLKKGLLALQSKAFTHAKEYFGKTGTAIMAPLLKIVVELSARDLSSSAESALVRLAKSVDLPVGDKYDQSAWLSIISKTTLTGNSPKAVQDKIDAYRTEFGDTDICKGAEPVLSALVNKVKEDARAVEASMSDFDSAAIKKALMKHNEGLAEEDIVIEKSQTYPGCRIVVRSEGLSDLIGLRMSGGKGISELDISRSRVKDLAPISGVDLRSLNVSDTKVMLVPMFLGMPLERLNLRNTLVKDGTPLSRFKLKELDLSDTKISDFKSIQRMPLESLELSNTYIKDRDFELLKDLPLKRLWLRNSSISSIAPLKNMSLELLDLCGSTAIGDFSPLVGMPMKQLYLDKCNLRDLGPFKGMPLEHLRAVQTQVEDLRPLKGSPLRTLNLDGSRVRDLSPLADMKQLGYLSIAGTQVSDLGPLKGLPLTGLNIANTKVKDLSPLKGMLLASLQANGISPGSWAPLKGMPLVDLNMEITGNQGERDVLNSLQKLKRLNGQDWPPR